MAIIDVAQTGNASNTASWAGGVIPGPGDVPRIVAGTDYVLTFDEDIAFGPGDDTAALIVEKSDGLGKFVFGVNTTITMQGKPVFGGRNSGASGDLKVRLEIDEGVTWRLDTGVGNNLTIDLGASAGFGELVCLMGAGTETNRIRIEKIGTGTVKWNPVASYSSYAAFSNCDFVGIDQVWRPEGILGAADGITGAIPGFFLDRCTFDENCGQLDMSSGPLSDAPWVLNECTLKQGDNATTCLQYTRNQAAGANAALINNVFRGQVALNEVGVTAEDNAFLEFVDVAGSGKATSNARNLRSNSGIHQATFSGHSDHVHGISYHRNPLDLNTWMGFWPGVFDQEIDGCCWCIEADTNQGDFQGPPAGASGTNKVCEIHHTIRTKARLTNNGGIGVPGPFFTSQTTTSNAEARLHHNTAYVNGIAGGVYLGENPAGDYPGQCTQYQSNLCVGRGVSGQGYHIDADPANAANSNNWVLAVNCTHNGGWNLQTGLRGHYNFSGDGTPGANDVYADPLFYAPDRSPVSWAQQYDGGVTNPDGFVALVLTKNDYGTHPDVKDAVASLRDYLFRGYYPQEPVYHGTAYDATNIGAVQEEYAPSGGAPVPTGDKTGLHLGLGLGLR